jgi:hypothetical protein
MSTRVRSRAAASNTALHLVATQSLQGEKSIDAQKLRVYNRSGESFLSFDVAEFDPSERTLQKLFEDLAVQSGTGFWLKPYRGVPSAAALPQFDLVFLDEECRVIQQIESYSSPSERPLTGATSVLVLPARTVVALQIKPGNQLAICASKEMERLLGLLSSPICAASVAHRTETAAEEPQKRDDSAAPLSQDHPQELQLAVHRQSDGKTESQGRKKNLFKVRLLQWLFPDRSGRRKAGRHPLPGLIAYHWTGGTPQANNLGDMSKTGFYLLTEERPFLGSLILMTLQRTGTNGENCGDSIAVHAKVVRLGPDGVGFAFVMPRSANWNSGNRQDENGATQKSLEEFLKQLNLPQCV